MEMVKMADGAERSMDEVVLACMIERFGRYFKMNEVCGIAGVSYSTYKGWRYKGFVMSDEKVRAVTLAFRKLAEDILSAPETGSEWLARGDCGGEGNDGEE